MNYINILDNSSKKYLCPKCGKKSFVRYKNTNTNDYLPNKYGRCDREDTCQYHMKPSNKASVHVQKQYVHFKAKPIKKITFFDFETYKLALESKRFKKNVFLQNLIHNIAFPFPENEVKRVAELYHLGTIIKGFYAGAITFPFIDMNFKIRAVQVKKFDKTNHTTNTTFLHSILAKNYKSQNKEFSDWFNSYLENEKKITCLFGANLLNQYPKNPVALVEAPKTAIIGTLYYGHPQDSESNPLFVAVYNKSSLSFGKIKDLAGRKVFVYPDLSINGKTFLEWKQKLSALKKQLENTEFIFMDLLEKTATASEKEKGLDLADYLIKFDWKTFRMPKEQENKPVHIKEPINNVMSEINEKRTNIIENELSNLDWESETFIKETEAMIKTTLTAIRTKKLPKYFTIHSRNNLVQKHDSKTFLQKYISQFRNNFGTEIGKIALEQLQKARRQLYI